MSDDRLKNAASDAVRRMAGGEPPPDPRERSTTDSTYGLSPAELRAWAAQADPEPDAAEYMDADEGAEEPEAEPREEPTELGQAAADAVDSWFPHRTPVKLEDLETLEDEMAAQDQAAAEEPFATSARDFVQAAVEAQDQIAAESGMTVEEYLVGWALATPEEWVEGTGLPPSAQPRRADLGRAGQAAFDRAGWEADLADAKARGRSFGQ